MTYVVTEACIKCKYTDCVEVCPVDCFYEGENMLVIHPDECIDCGVCEPECPADAISRTPSPAWRSGSRSTPSTPRAGPTSPRRRTSRPTRKNLRVSRASSRNTFPRNPAAATDSLGITPG